MTAKHGGILAALLVACSHPAPWPDVVVVGESSRVRVEGAPPPMDPWFDGARVTLVAARGETLGLQVYARGGARLTLEGAAVRGYAVESFTVRRASTEMYGGSQGRGTYADGLTLAAAPTTDPAYFEVDVARDAAPGAYAGTLVAAGRTFPVSLAVVPVTLPALAPRVWAYFDPRELSGAAAEAQCRAVFRAYGAWLTPDLPLAQWPARRASVADMPDVPVIISTDPGKAAEEVRGWIAATAGTGQVPFTIPIDEPHTPADRARVRALADAVRSAGGGPRTFRYAVTDSPHAEYGDAVDLYISPAAAHLTGDAVARWTYNGAPPRAGSLVLDAASPGMRTWGWIAWRWKISVWYVWDALYWHDRHNRAHRVPLVAAQDPISFDDGEDRGNFDGVLALPAPDGCRPTLRLAALRRGLQDRLLLEAAAKCAPIATAGMAAELVPRALGDAPLTGAPSWPTDDAAWELARRRLLTFAAAACL